MKLLLLFLFLTAIPFYGQAQDAKVVELTASDARDAAKLYADMKSAEKNWSDFQDKIQRTYKGFDGGIEFSSNFKFIVPKMPATPSQAFWYGNCFVGNGGTSVPAIQYTPSTIPSQGSFLFQN